MRTSTGFYSKARGHGIISEDVEIIQVEPRSDEESDIVSEVSEGGWISKGDEVNKTRSLQNKTLWKIMEEDKGPRKE